jgi:hypothetical protein
LKKQKGNENFVVSSNKITPFPMKQRFVDEITKILGQVPIVKNLARKKFISQFVIGLIKSGNVQFKRVAEHLNARAKISSNEVRIQDFFREVDLDYVLVSTLLLSLLPRRGKLRVCIDRTEWDFGTHQVNILMVTLGSADFALPIVWELLDNKSGNSSSEQRKDLLDELLILLDSGRIGLLIADREFIGREWFNYLKKKDIPFLVRMPKHHLIYRNDGRIQRVDELGLKINTPLLLKNCMMDGVLGHVWVMLIKNGDYLFLFSTIKQPKFMGQMYRKRWTIEACFQNLKGRGFDLEKTHLKSNVKLKKLIALVSLAYGLCLNLGIYYHQNIEVIKCKNHGYKTNSFARKGIDLIREWTREYYPAPEFVPKIMQLAARYIRAKLYFLKIAG